MKKKVLSILFVLLFLTFIGIMDYPFLAQLFNEWNQTAAAVEYEDMVKDLSEADKERYLQAAREYNQSLSAGAVMNLETPFADAGIQNTAYKNLLAVQESAPLCVIEIPKIALSLPVYHGTSDEVLEKGAGHMEGSSFPIGGDGTHACIAAHRGLPTKRLFTDLDQIEEGDLFFIKVLDEICAYQVYQTEVVEPDNLESLVITEGEDRVTLITCTPYGINTHRIYVHGTRIPYEEAVELEGALSAQGFWKTWWWVAATAVLLAWMCVLLRWFNRRPQEPASNEKG